MKKNIILSVFVLAATLSILLVSPVAKTRADSVYTDGYQVDISEMINTHIGDSIDLSQEERVYSRPASNDDVIMFRVVRNCSDGRFHYGKETNIDPFYHGDGHVRYGQLNTYDLEYFRGGAYRNYICGSRYQQQCINDGSFDTYYDELCIKRPNVEIDDFTYDDAQAQIEFKNIGNNDNLILYRGVLDCATDEPVGERTSNMIKKADGKYVLDFVQVFDLEDYSNGGYYNYTCGNRYQGQCISDGSFDTYYQEICIRVSGIDDITPLLDYAAQEINSGIDSGQIVIDQPTVPKTTTVVSSNNPYKQGNSAIKKLIRQNISNASSHLNNPISYRPSSNKDMTLFRIVRNCSDGSPYGESYSRMTEFKHDQWIIGNLQMIDLERSENGYYGNYTCGNRYQHQCINDGSFDTYYEEYCSYGVK